MTAGVPGQLVRARRVTVRDQQRLTGESLGATAGDHEFWLLGTGTPNSLANRSGPSNLVKAGREAMLVDCGNGTARQMAQLGVPLADISTIFITHHHVDHNADLAFLLLSPWITKTLTSAPVIVGPPGTVDHVDRLLAAHEYDLQVRMPHGYDPADVAPDVIEVRDGDVIDLSSGRVQAIQVDHAPVEHAYGYRFDSPSGSVVFSGDTRPSDNLIAAAHGADVLVHEALMPGWGIPEYHTSVDEVGDVATKAEVGRLVLTHLIPGTLPDEEWLARVQPSFAGPVEVGHDLMRIR